MSSPRSAVSPSRVACENQPAPGRSGKARRRPRVQFHQAPQRARSVPRGYTTSKVKMGMVVVSSVAFDRGRERKALGEEQLIKD